MLKESSTKIVEDLFIDPKYLEYMWDLDSDILGFRPMWSAGKNINFNNLPSWIVKQKYKNIDYPISEFYLKNINLIRKLEKLINSKPFQYMKLNEKIQLINTSSASFFEETGVLIYRESYKIDTISRQNYCEYDISEKDFYEVLDESITEMLVSDMFNKKFSELTDLEVETLTMYWK